MDGEMIRPHVSVVMPAFNAERTIRESIESVISQSYDNWELIVIEDQSADTTPRIIKQAAEQNPRIRLLMNQQNNGAAASRNRGIREAKGEYIAFLDSDDLWHTDKLKKQLEFMKENNAVISYTATAYIKNGVRSDYVLRAEKQLTCKELLKGNIMSCSSVMVKHETMLRHMFPIKSFRLHEDVATWFSVLQEEKYAYGLNEPLLIYRMSGSSKAAGRIASAAMTYNAYRGMGYNAVSSFLFTLRYAVHSISKRYKIKAGVQAIRL